MDPLQVGFQTNPVEFANNSRKKLGTLADSIPARTICAATFGAQRFFLKKTDETGKQCLYRKGQNLDHINRTNNIMNFFQKSRATPTKRQLTIERNYNTIHVWQLNTPGYISVW
jgi:hypothetical protein